MVSEGRSARPHVAALLRDVLLQRRAIRRQLSLTLLLGWQQNGIDHVNDPIRSVDVCGDQAGIVHLRGVVHDANFYWSTFECLRLLCGERLVRIDATGDDVIFEDIDEFLLVLGFQQ